ncbi:hypothetical protein G6045_19815 [Streptomyces sp. YC504]|uniref:Uncharacterized protein n=1 Tax=Streptomyces mesophilus TaxID=1775132 RepID=A0A6G4XKE5_9ACTN|nr:hypothetical protein [Streptomyces mesophilus]
MSSITDYLLLRRTRLALRELYVKEGRYWYSGGWNWRAVLAFTVGALLAVGGSHSAPGKGPFPEDGLIPFLKPLSDYGWAVGLASAAVLYLVLSSRRGVDDRLVEDRQAQ